MRRGAGDAHPAAANDPAGAEAIVVHGALPGTGENDKNEELLAGIARRAAAHDPAGAERIYARLTQRRVKLNMMANLCAGMAISDVSRAAPCPCVAGAPGVAALTAAVAARIKRADDPDGAKALLAEAYDRLEPLTGADGRSLSVDGEALAAGRPGRSGTVIGIPLAGDRGAAAARRPARSSGRGLSRSAGLTGSSPSLRRSSPATIVTRPRRSSRRSPRTPGP